MPLELRRNRDGTLRPCFYGRYQDKTGNLKCANLGVDIQGCPPKSLHGSGDKDFEESRKRAEKKLAELIEEGRTSRGTRYWARRSMNSRAVSGWNPPPLQACLSLGQPFPVSVRLRRFICPTRKPH